MWMSTDPYTTAYHVSYSSHVILPFKSLYMYPCGTGASISTQTISAISVDILLSGVGILPFMVLCCYVLSSVIFTAFLFVRRYMTATFTKPYHCSEAFFIFRRSTEHVFQSTLLSSDVLNLGTSLRFHI